jgi:predicted MPP superfamily phosphohydrolase
MPKRAITIATLLSVCLGALQARQLRWTDTSYPDSSWSIDRAEMGFGDGDETTVLDSTSKTCYFRKDFYLDDPENYHNLSLHINYDDGFVAYVNGVERARSASMPEGKTNYHTLARTEHEGGTFETYNMSIFLSHCDYGWNDYFPTVAIEVHQSEEDWLSGNRDFTFDACVTLDGDTVIDPGGFWRYWESTPIPPTRPPDTVASILRPIRSIPALVRPGETFTIDVMGPEGMSAFDGYLHSPHNMIHLDLDPSYESACSTWHIEATVPEDAPMELYDLVLDGTPRFAELSRRAVKVIQEFKDEFYFIQVTDTHVPEHYGSESSVEEFERVIEEVNILSPEFVVITGDQVNRGDAEDQYIWFLDLLDRFEDPTYVVSGNHDLSEWCGDGSSRRNWWKYMGWKHLNPNHHLNQGYYTQDYTFDYGDCHFVGMESYSSSWSSPFYATYGTRSFISTQLDWLDADLASNMDKALRVLFFHYDFRGQLYNRYDDYEVELVLYGHVHANITDTIGTTPTIYLCTNATCDDRGYYRILHVEDGDIVEHPVLQYSSIEMGYSPVNDGSTNEVVATITNDHGRGFEDIELEFLVLNNGSPYYVTSGEILQVIDAGPYLVYYVSVDVDAHSLRSFRIHQNPGGLSIYDIQYTEDPSGNSPYLGEEVTVSGIATVASGIFEDWVFYLEDPVGGPWTGIEVHSNMSNPTPVEEGDSVSVTGVVSEMFFCTQIDASDGEVSVLSSGQTVPGPTSVPSGDLATGSDYAESYEGVLVELADVTVTDEDVGYGEWLVDDGSGECRVDDRATYSYEPALDDTLAMLRGVVYFNNQNYKVEPRYDEDIAVRFDIDGDRRIDYQDVLVLSAHLAGGEPLDLPTAVGDVNRDGRVSTADLYALIGLLYKGIEDEK